MAEILIEGRRLDVYEGLDFSFNYSIADVRDPNKRSTSFSKTIKCPATKNNDVLFGNIWSTNISNLHNSNSTNIEANFNPNKKANALVIQDGVTVMDGVVQLRAINIDNGKYEYEVVFIGKLKNIFSEIGDKQLNDFDASGTPYIDFSDLDHKFTFTNITNSWNNTTGYVYPLIDYGVSFLYTTGGRRIYDVENFRPCVYVKDIFDRIFDYAGYTYTSTFLNSVPFTKLVTPFHAEDFTLTDDHIESRQCISEVDADDNIFAGGSQLTIGSLQYYQRQLEFVDLSDPTNQWNPTTSRFETAEIGYYKFTLNSFFRLNRVVGPPPPQPAGSTPYEFRLMKLSGGNTTVLDQFSTSIDLTGGTTQINWSSDSILLEVGDEVYIETLYDYQGWQLLEPSFDMLHLENSTFSVTVGDEEITEGLDVYMNNFAPSVKMSDILLGVFKMFNLYVTIDEGNPNNLIIETRDEYYSGGKVKDWTYKLARDKKVNIKPLGLLSAKEYEYTYKSDKDYYNSRYEDSRGNVYGTREVKVDNDFLNNDKKVSIAFSATPLANDDNTSRIIPKIYDEDIEDGGKPVDINFRVLYYAGNLTSDPSWVFRYDRKQSQATQFNYPYAGHLDNPITPTLDLNFGIPKQLYYTSNGYTGTLQYTNANLFNLYHRAHINEITNKDAKVFSGEFYLTPFDIEQLDFRDQILIDNTYWRLNKISNYNPFKEGLTKVELFKVLDLFEQDAQSFSLGSSGVVGNGTVSVEKKPYNKQSTKSNFNQFPLGKGSVNGKNNRVSKSAFNFKVIGDNNFVGEGSKNITVLGNDNYIAFGASNVVLINTDNATVNESNVTIIDGKKQWRTVTKDVDYTANDREVVLADSSKAAPPITITLPKLSEGLWVCVKKTDSTAGNVDITAGVSGLVDGVGTYSLTTQYESVELFCDGSNWHIRSNA